MADHTAFTSEYTMQTVQGSGLQKAINGPVMALVQKDVPEPIYNPEADVGDSVAAGVVISGNKMNAYVVGAKINADQEDLKVKDIVIDKGDGTLSKYTIADKPGFTVQFNKPPTVIDEFFGHKQDKNLEIGAPTPDSAAALEKLTDALSKLPPGIYKVDQKTGEPVQVDKDGNEIKGPTQPAQPTPPAQPAPTVFHKVHTEVAAAADKIIQAGGSFAAQQHEKPVALNTPVNTPKAQENGIV